MSSRMGYLKRGTLWGLAGGGVNASVVMMGRCRVPMTPRWSKKTVWTVAVSSIWREIRLESHMVRWAMHDFWSGCWRGVKMGFVGPAHLLYVRQAMRESFADDCPHPP